MKLGELGLWMDKPTSFVRMCSNWILETVSFVLSSPLPWTWILFYPGGPDYFADHMGDYEDVLASLETLNLSILKAMDYTKRVSCRHPACVSTLWPVCSFQDDSTTCDGPVSRPRGKILQWILQLILKSVSETERETLTRSNCLTSVFTSGLGGDLGPGCQ